LCEKLDSKIVLLVTLSKFSELMCLLPPKSYSTIWECNILCVCGSCMLNALVPASLKLWSGQCERSNLTKAGIGSIGICSRGFSGFSTTEIVWMLMLLSSLPFLASWNSCFLHYPAKHKSPRAEALEALGTYQEWLLATINPWSTQSPKASHKASAFFDGICVWSLNFNKGCWVLLQWNATKALYILWFP